MGCDDPRAQPAQLRAGAQLHQAAGIAAGDDVGIGGGERVELARQNRPRHLGVGQVVDARRAAAGRRGRRGTARTSMPGICSSRPPRRARRLPGRGCQVTGVVVTHRLASTRPCGGRRPSASRNSATSRTRPRRPRPRRAASARPRASPHRSRRSSPRPRRPRGPEGRDVAAREPAGGRRSRPRARGALRSSPARCGDDDVEAVARQHPHAGGVDAAEELRHDAADEEADRPRRSPSAGTISGSARRFAPLRNRGQQACGVAQRARQEARREAIDGRAAGAARSRAARRPGAAGDDAEAPRARPSVRAASASPPAARLASTSARASSIKRAEAEHRTDTPSRRRGSRGRDSASSATTSVSGNFGPPTTPRSR